MKKVLLVLMLFISAVSFSQTYVSGSVSIYNRTGNFDNKGMATVEVGKTWDVFSIGLAGGVTSFSQGNAYLELRSSVKVFEKGKVSLSPNLGVGYVFDSNTDYLVEYGGTCNLSLNKNHAISLFAGVYHFNGTNAYNKATFTGVGYTYTFK